METQFSEDVASGLTSNPKFLSSKYFYDEIGDKLFIDIMNMPEYYLFRAEFEIFQLQSEQIINGLGVNKNNYFELIELGAGDGTKTKELLKELSKQGFNFSYLPIDISQNSLNNLEASLKEEQPDIDVKKKQGEYFEVLESFKDSSHPKVVLFLGSNIGNLKDSEAHDFLYRLGSSLKSNDKLFLGVDLIKHVDIVLPAYNDKTQITASFNLNLLTRINKELGANFDLQYFKHRPEYTIEEGIAKSYLVSEIDQEVYVKAIDTNIHFKAGEKIHTEISRKYNESIVNEILEQTDFEVINKFTDSKNQFADFVLVKN